MDSKQLFRAYKKRVEEQDRKRKLVIVGILFAVAILAVVFINVFPVNQPKEQIGGGLSQVIEFVNVTNHTTSQGFKTIQITLLNTGETPLSDFMVFLDNKKIEPYYVPETVYPGKEINIILFPEQSAEWQETEGVILIMAKDGGRIQIKTSKSPITGSFIYVA